MKSSSGKISLVVLLALFSLIAIVSPVSAQQPMSVAKGDVNGDGKVDLSDAVLMMQSSVLASSEGDIFKTSDVDQDGRVGLVEAIYALQITAQSREAAQSRAVLGPLSDAAVQVYRLNDLEQPVYQTRTDGDGYFSTDVADIVGDDLFLVKVSGGYDIDANDDGEIDPVPTKNLGAIHALISGSEFKRGGFFVSAITDLAWQYTKNLLGDTDSAGLYRRLDELAKNFFKADVNGDALVSAADFFSFSPLDAVHKNALNFDYQILLAQNQEGQSIIGCYHENLPEAQMSLLDTAFGDRLTLFPAADSQTDKVKLQVAVLGEGQVMTADNAISIHTSGPDPTSNVASAFYDPNSDTTVVLMATPTDETEILSWQGCDSVSEDGTQCVCKMRNDHLVTVAFGFKETRINENIQLVDLTQESVIVGEDQILLDVTLTSGAISDLDYLGVGDVVVSGTGEGFLRRIVNIENIAAGHYLLTTSDVPLEEVISQGTGTLFKQMTYSDLIEPASTDRSPSGLSTTLVGVETVAGVRFMQGDGPDDRVFKFVIGDDQSVEGADSRVPMDSIGGDLIWTDPVTGLELTLNGTIDVTIDVETGVSFKGLKMQDFTFIPRINAQESLSLSISGELETPKLEKTIATFYFSPITFAIGPVPVVICPQVDLVIGINAKIGAQVYTSISFSSTARAGIVYNRSAGVNVVKEFTTSHDFTKPTMTNYAQISPYIKGSPSMKIYGVTGPGVYLKGYLRLKGEAETPVFGDEPCPTGLYISAYGGMNGGFEWELGLLKKVLGDWSENVKLSLDLYTKEWLLRKWNVAGDCTEPPFLEVLGSDILKTVWYGSSEIVSKQYTLKNTGELPLNWRIGFIEDGAISVAPQSGSLGQTETVTVTVSIDIGKLSEGIYNNKLNFENSYDPGLLAGYVSGSTSRLVRVEVLEQTSNSTFTNSLGMTFNLIPAGTFTMGSPTDEPGRDSRETQHEVTLTQSYYMQTTEVTQGQWRSVTGSNPSYFSSCGDDCPVENVSWNDIQSFINALNNLGQGTYRLPTEAEWEYAARAGSTTAFANGGITVTDCGYDPNLDAMGWYCGNASSRTHPVAGKQPNAWGLYDMHGNVWEWCQDWYGTYPTGAVTDPTGPSWDWYRVLRGGGWRHVARYCRSAYRNGGDPSYRFNYNGFRLVCLQVP